MSIIERPNRRALLLAGTTLAAASAMGTAFVVQTARAQTVPTPSLSPQEAQDIARDAYIYAYPMLENYRTMLVTLDKLSPKFWAPLNQFYHVPQLSTPAYTTVILTNNDTLYSRAWLDLRTEPIVLSVPAFPTGRYYSHMFTDMFTHNLWAPGRTAMLPAITSLSGPIGRGPRSLE